MKNNRNGANLVLATGFVSVGFGAHVGGLSVGMSVRAGALRWVRQFKEKLVANAAGVGSVFWPFSLKFSFLEPKGGYLFSAFLA